MANPGGKSQFHWNLSFVFSLLLILGAGQLAADDIKPSGYNPMAGDRFYLLSEATFGSTEEAQVRLEAPEGTDIEAYNGVDIRLYRIADPLTFLKKQKNLHRPSITAEHTKDGIANALSYLWDSWYKKSRLVWQRVVAEKLRTKAVESAPQLKQVPPYSYRTRFENPAQFKPIPGLEVVDQFRYPVFQAKPIEPPAGVQVTGSTLTVRKGNARIPLGHLKPGLYLTEALLGSFRATCFVFVSDTVALTKLSSQQEIVWTVKKDTGEVVPDVQLVMTDGIGVLGEGRSDDSGIYTLTGKNLERSYVLGQDKDGGIVVSENFYYDSEVYSNKIYMFTDRPLYQPGDTVQVKVLGREFMNSRKSMPLANAAMRLSVFDAAGIKITEQTMAPPSLVDGANSSFTLPDEATAGGYSLQLQYKQITYTAAFRVARYVKPHFQIEVNFDKPSYKTGETIKGNVQLTYGNGEAVKDAHVELDIRKQRLTIVEGEVEARDRFPIQALQTTLTSDGQGKASFEIPAATESTRFTVLVKAADQSSFRVSATKDLLIQMVERPLALRASTHFSQSKDKVAFQWNNSTGQKPVSWEAIRLQDQSRTEGKLDKNASEVQIPFGTAGNYSVHVLDAQGLILGSVSHTVLGPELTTIPGTIAILFDKDAYEIGETARASITFSEPIKAALVTMELDQVERYTLIQNSQKWIRLTKQTDQQYIAEIPIEEAFSPNITLSFAYVSKGQYVFENRGLKIKQPSVKIAIQPDRPEYKPGDTVNLSIQTTFQERPQPTTLTLSVVDEMVYVLQPEIAPSILDFFYHPRRNQVRTASSLSFHSYDAAVSAIGAMPTSATSDYAERSFKVRVRPRRDDRDTAAWTPTLRTDEQGRAKLSFVMPDSLTRWRVTARAASAEGLVGQQTLSLLSTKDVYLKWTGVDQFREGDQSDVQVAVFNMLDKKQDFAFEAKSAAGDFKKTVTLEPGPNYVKFPQTFKADTTVLMTVKNKNQVVDQLEVPITVTPVPWSLPKKADVNSDFKWPALAKNVRLTLSSNGIDAFLQATDDLIEYPYGCVEQTSSRLIPLALVQMNFKKASLPPNLEQPIKRQLVAARTRLVNMAGPEAQFTWWGGNGSPSLLVTGYAYFADWWASKAIGIELPKNHWESLLDLYSKQADQALLSDKVLFVWMAGEMNLPVKTLVQGLVDEVAANKKLDPGDMYGVSQNALRNSVLLFVDVLSRKHGVTIPPEVATRIQEAQESAEKSFGFDRVVHLLDTGKGDKDMILGFVKSGWPTIERSISLVILYKAMGGSLDRPNLPEVPALGNAWVQKSSPTGRAYWSPRAGLPAPGELPSPPPNTVWSVSYDSFEEAKGNLNVQIERKLFKLVQKEKALNYTMQAVDKPWKLDPKDLYIDMLELKPTIDTPAKFGLVVAGLPPGGTVEETTWGLSVSDAEGAKVDLDASGLQAGAGYYARALEELSGPRKIYQLVRFSQAGRFTIPGTRYFKMYDPGQQAFEGGSSSATQTIQVQ